MDTLIAASEPRFQMDFILCHYVQTTCNVIALGWGEHPEDSMPFQASCSLCQGVQVCFGVKCAEEGELLAQLP